MSSMKPGTPYVANGSITAMNHGQPLPGKSTVGNANAKGGLPAKNGGKGKRTTTEGPLKPAMARGKAMGKNGRGKK